MTHETEKLPQPPPTVETAQQPQPQKLASDSNEASEEEKKEKTQGSILDMLMGLLGGMGDMIAMLFVAIAGLFSGKSQEAQADPSRTSGANASHNSVVLSQASIQAAIKVGRHMEKHHPELVEEMKADMMKVYDTSGDGKISPEEQKAFLDKGDLNRDGQLSKQELVQMTKLPELQDVMNKHVERLKQVPGLRTMVENFANTFSADQHSAPPTPTRTERDLGFDLNKDGGFDMKDIAQATGKNPDLDGDGVFSRKELRQANAALTKQVAQNQTVIRAAQKGATFMAATGEVQAKNPRAFDVNGDGRSDIGDIAVLAGGNPDLDGDGRLSQEEAKGVNARLAEVMKGHEQVARDFREAMNNYATGTIIAAAKDTSKGTGRS